MADYKDPVPRIKRWEGGIGGDPRDNASSYPSPCGIDPEWGTPYHTNKGVTWGTYVNFDPTPTCSEWTTMSDDLWGRIFKQRFWDKIGGDQIKNQAIANAYVNWIFMSGPGNANPLMQRMLRDRYNYPFEQTNTITKRVEILNYLTKKDVKKLFEDMYAVRTAYFQSLSGCPTYCRGWLRRLNEEKIADTKYLYIDVQFDNVNYTSAILLSLIGLAFFLILYYFRYLNK